jgi:cytochrome d ubiquinol oxidase subunit I
MRCRQVPAGMIGARWCRLSRTYVLLIAAYVSTLFLLAAQGREAAQAIETGPTPHPNAFVAAE